MSSEIRTFGSLGWFAELLEFGGCGGSLGSAAGRFAVGAGCGFATALLRAFFRERLETGPAGFLQVVFFAVAMSLLEADCGVSWRVGDVLMVGSCRV